jgi:hypothetical protein
MLDEIVSVTLRDDAAHPAGLILPISPKTA